MWKKDEEAPERTSPRPEPRSSPAPAVRPSGTGNRATIGRSITVRGDVSGDEDLLVQGRLEGSVDLQENTVTVGTDGAVKASVVARSVMIEGRVEGDVVAHEQIILRSTAWVHGDLTAPRVVLEDGAQFRGGVDMGEMAGTRGSNSKTVDSKRKLDIEGTTSGSSAKTKLESDRNAPKVTSESAVKTGT